MLRSYFIYAVFILLLFAGIVLAAPSFAGDATQNNNTEFNPDRNYGIQINITDTSGGTPISAANFTINITGANSTFSRNANGDSDYVNFNNTTAAWFINFTGGQLGAGIYRYNWGANNSTGATGTSISSARTFNISKNVSNPVNLNLNGTVGDRTYTYPQVIGLSATGNNTPAQFYQNGTNVTTTPNLLLGIGGYNFSTSTTGNQNYSANATGSNFNATVVQGTPSLSITFSPSASVSTGTSVTVQCSASISNESSALSLTLSREGAAVQNPETVSFSNSRGIVYSCSNAATTNYSATSTSGTLTITGGSSTPRISVTEIPDGAQVSIPSIAPDNKTIVDINISQQPIRYLEISVINKVYVIDIKITQLNAKPAIIPVDPPQTIIYKYVDIAQANLGDNNVQSIKMKAAVPKSWITSNNIDSDKVVVDRFNNNIWNSLVTRKLSETTDEIIYEVETPGFSTFSIGGEILVAPPPTEICGDRIDNDNDGLIDEDCLPAASPPTDMTTVYIIIVLVAVGGVGGYLFFVKKDQVVSFFRKNFFRKK